MGVTVETIFCDDVRQEITGKQTLVGVYCSDLRIAGPGSLIIHIWQRISGLAVGNHQFEFHLTVPGKSEPVASGRGNMEISTDQFPVPLFFGPFHLSVEEEGYLVFQPRIDGVDAEAGKLFIGLNAADILSIATNQGDTRQS